MTLHRALLGLSAATAVIFLHACGSDEPSGTGDDHTPVSYTVLVDSNEAHAPFTLESGQTYRVQLKFVNAGGDDLDDIEGEHFAGLVFNPASLASATRDTDHHYRFSMTGGTVGTGTVQVSFGHDEAADETSFDPVALTIHDNSNPAP
jgi:hypothetical protein